MFFDRHLHIEIPLLIQAQEEVITIERLEHIHPTPVMCTSTCVYRIQECASYFLTPTHKHVILDNVE
jgi:hypothetical protein